MAPRDARPLILAGERAAARGDPAEAMRLWTTLIAVQPPSFNLVARRYAACARATAKEAAALERLEALYGQTPTMDLLETIASLQPDPAARQARILAHLREHPTMAAAQALLAPRGAHASPAGAAASPGASSLGAAEAGALDDAVRRAARPLHRYRCAACGFEAEHYFWQCPGCLGWDTYPRATPGGLVIRNGASSCSQPVERVIRRASA